MTLDMEKERSWSASETASSALVQPPPIAFAEPSLNERKHGGTFFDERLSLRDPEGIRFIDRAMEALDAIEARQKALRPDDRENRRTLVGKLLANAFRCFYHREPSRVAYWRKADGYRGKPAWLSGTAMGRTVDLFEQAGLFKCGLGRRGDCSTYVVTQKLHELAFECGITQHSIVKRLPLDQLVRLYTSHPEHDQLDFIPNDQTRLWASELEAYNDFLARQDLGIEELTDDWKLWVEKLNDPDSLKGMPYYRPEQIQTDLFRSFNNSSFEEGGRLYGGWWTNAPKAIRRRIRINDRPTVELDYSSHHLRMLYNQRGHDPRGDLYLLEPVAAYEGQLGLEPRTFRPCVKALTQALINGPPNGRPASIKLKGDVILPPRFKAAEIVRMIEERHQPIADAFRSGAGLRLQRLDSDIALEIVLTLMREGIVALPVHDSFIVTGDNEHRLRWTMETVYHSKLGHNPIVENK